MGARNPDCCLVGDGGGDPVLALFDRRIRQSDLSVFPHPPWTSISTSNASTPTTAAE
jgi:hypothetical protein